VEAVNPGTYWIRVQGGHWDIQGYYRLHVEFVAQNAHTVTASAGAGGSISPAGNVVTTDGGILSFSISPDACHEVADVLVDGVSVGAQDSYTFTNITGDHFIEASFVASTNLTINIISDGNGVIIPSEGAVTVGCGADQTIEIVALPGYKILDVKVDGVSVNDPLTVGFNTTYTFTNVSSNHTVTVSFTDMSNYIITTVAGTNGSIVP